MITLSENAQKELEAYFEGKEKEIIRIFLAPGGCSGPRLALMVDEADDNDTKEEAGGFIFCIKNDLLSQIKSASIDATPFGFDVAPEIPLPASEGGCGSCCGGCGSH